MATIAISQQVFDKYNINNKLRLSVGYLQRVFESDGHPGNDGIVQILKGKEDSAAINGIAYVYRVRISDGIFQYNTLISSAIEEQVQREKEHLVEGSIIALTGIDIIPAEGKPSFIITGYTLLSRHHAILADVNVKAQGHNGLKETHFGYKSSIVIEDDWAEVQNYITNAEENKPPSAKKAKNDDGTARAKTSAAPPPPARKGSSKMEGGVIPITAVTPYVNNFKIHGMITRKEELKTIPAKNLKIFNFEITDSNGDCIRITAFNETAESVSSTIVENMSYYISGGTVRVANKKFNNTGHDYEITLRSDSKVEPGGEIFSQPKLNIKRTELNKISSHLGNLIDILVVVERMDDSFTEFTSRQGKQFIKREMDVIDESAVQARVTLWGDDAKNACLDWVGKVLVFKGVSPREFNGSYSLSTGGSTRIYNTPEVAGVAELYDWYQTEKPNTEIKMMSQMTSNGGEAPRTIAGLTEMRFGNESEKGDYATIKAMITRINPNNILYKGCSNEGCQKKVVESDGEYRCEKCMSTSRDFKWLYMMQIELSDATGQVYVTAFGDTAAKIVGKSAADVGDMKDTDPDTFNNIFETLQFKPRLWRVRCKMETYNEEVKQRVTVFSVEDVNQEKYLSQLEELVKQLEEIQ